MIDCNRNTWNDHKNGSKTSDEVQKKRTDLSELKCPEPKKIPVNTIEDYQNQISLMPERLKPLNLGLPVPGAGRSGKRHQDLFCCVWSRSSVEDLKLPVSILSCPYQLSVNYFSLRSKR